MLVVVGGRGREGRGCCVVVDGGGVGKSDELAMIRLCALSYTARNGMCSNSCCRLHMPVWCSGIIVHFLPKA